MAKTKTGYRVVYGETIPAWEQIFPTQRMAEDFAEEHRKMGNLIFSIKKVVPGEAPQSLAAAIEAKGGATSWNRILEDAIVGKIVAALIDDGFRIEISDQDGVGLFIYAAANGGRKPKGGFNYLIRLTPGNGVDVIADYTTNLEKTLEPVFKFQHLFTDVDN